MDKNISLEPSPCNKDRARAQGAGGILAIVTIAALVIVVWAVTRHEDISYVSKNPELFCSGQGVMIEAVPEDILDAAQSFLAMDGTKHSTLRRLVSSVFTPRQVSKIQDQIEAQAAVDRCRQENSLVYHTSLGKSGVT